MCVASSVQCAHSGASPYRYRVWERSLARMRAIPALLSTPAGKMSDLAVHEEAVSLRVSAARMSPMCEKAWG